LILSLTGSNILISFAIIDLEGIFYTGYTSVIGKISYLVNFYEDCPYHEISLNGEDNFNISSSLQIELLIFFILHIFHNLYSNNLYFWLFFCLQTICSGDF
jgi:hypothetical protein